MSSSGSSAATRSTSISSASTTARSPGRSLRSTAIRDITVDGRSLRARADDGGRAVPLVLGALESAGVEVSSVRVARPSLDDVYLKYTGRTFDAAEAEATQ